MKVSSLEEENRLCAKYVSESCYGQDQLQLVHIPEAQEQIDSLQKDLVALREESYERFAQAFLKVCLALLWQHTACSRPNGKALVSCTSPVHPVLFSMHVDAVAHAIIAAY